MDPHYQRCPFLASRPGRSATKLLETMCELLCIELWKRALGLSPHDNVCEIVNFCALVFGGAHSAFRLMIACAVRYYGFLFRTPPPIVCRPYLTTADKVFRSSVFRIFGVTPEVQTHDQIKCATC
jgi:hypothetical protein